MRANWLHKRRQLVERLKVGNENILFFFKANAATSTVADCVGCAAVIYVHPLG